MVRAPLPLAVLGMLAAAPICGAAAQSDRTVSWYLRHPQAIGPKLAECEDDEAVAREPQCANAQRAADRLARLPRARAMPQPPIQTPDQTLTSPRYYAENPIARATHSRQVPARRRPSARLPSGLQRPAAVAPNSRTLIPPHADSAHLRRGPDIAIRCGARGDEERHRGADHAYSAGAARGCWRSISPSSSFAGGWQWASASAPSGSRCCAPR